MSNSQLNQENIKQYREAAIALHEVLVSTEQKIQSALESGDKQGARDAVADLKASGEKFENFRATLTARELFVAKYNIEVHGDHEVSFVLPKGVSRYEMLSEAQGLVEGRNLVWPGHLNNWQSDRHNWQSDRRFTDTPDTPERIRIDGHVQGGDGEDRETQTALVEGRGLTLPTLEDLAAAFVAHYVATGRRCLGGSKTIISRMWSALLAARSTSIVAGWTCATSTMTTAVVMWLLPRASPGIQKTR